ncbi:hypothetical protein O181_086407 [Austropuccinia psidii MF-1]|uniref:Uncharacterized protein n=1 Tax=Austropuccinia psidii MF-1 TaxID=1389203 RepID=A0A9Q3FZQ2_9BASI|nr:hypothetical protein [Austropuccinia psidii MF-1]
MSYGPQSVDCTPWRLLEGPRAKMTPWDQICWGSRGSMGPTLWPIEQFYTTWPEPIERVQDHQEPDLPKAEGEVLGSDLKPRGQGSSFFEDFEGGIIELWLTSLMNIFMLEVQYSDALNSSARINL